MTALIDTLFQLEKYLGLELDSLLQFAELDTIGGYHPDPSQRKWGSGAIWDVEGKTLYALIRALKPETIVEIGSGTGCSTTHMAAAVQTYGSGHITTIDRGNTPQIPDILNKYVTVTNGDAINYLALALDNSIDFLLEDADHSEALCAAIGELAKTKLKPGGVLMAHDAAHFGVGRDVKAGYDSAGLDFRVYLTDPSDCGWAVWKRPQLEVRGKGIGHVIEKYNLDVIGEELTRIYGEQADYSPFTTINEVTEGVEFLTSALHDDESTEEKLAKFPIDTTVLQAQEEPNAKPVKRTRKAKAKK